MNVQIGIIRYHTITDGMKYIIKLITLFHQFILYQQTGLCLNPSFGFTPVGTHQPHDRGYQQCEDRRIEKYKKVFIFPQYGSLTIVPLEDTLSGSIWKKSNCL